MPQVTDIKDIDQVNELQKQLKKDFTVNNGKIILTVIPNTVSSKKNGANAIADVILTMEGDTGIKFTDSVDQMLYGLFKSAELISKSPNMNTANDGTADSGARTSEELEQEMKKAFPMFKNVIYQFNPYIYTNADKTKPYEKVENGNDYPIGKIYKTIGAPTSFGGNKRYIKSSTKKKKLHNKNFKKQIRKTKSKKNVNNHKKNKIVKNGKKK